MIVGCDQNRPLDAVFINSPLKDYDIEPRRHDFTLPVLGLGYIATYARNSGFNVGVLDAEALGLGISVIADLTNKIAPRWVGLNLLAPSYSNSVKILQRLSSDTQVMLGGHQAQAMPKAILCDTLIPRIDAMILGEGEVRVKKLLENIDARIQLPHVHWRSATGNLHEGCANTSKEKTLFLAPDIDGLPFINRDFLSQDPFTAEDGRVEANLVGSRGCPYECSFCGAAKSANPDITIRTRKPENILAEMDLLANQYGVNAFRFVDDLFLASAQFMRACLPKFIESGVAKKWVWDATGRINVLAKADDSLISLIQQSGCREVALGIESGSERMLQYIDKHIKPDMTIKAVKDLTGRGINVKGYFILGFPTETLMDMQATIDLIKTLWDCSEKNPGRFRCSVFEFRPYPGTLEWHRLMATGRYSAKQLLEYQHIDLTQGGLNTKLLERDEFNFSVNLQFGEVPVSKIREEVSRLMEIQKERLR